MRRIILIFILVFGIAGLSGAQEYKTGVGLRAGISAGLTLKHFINDKAAFEGLLTTKWSGFDMTGLYEIHGQAFDVEHLNWYYGFGGHVGFWNGSNTPRSSMTGSYAAIGVDGILGIEYCFTEAPINIGLDWKPVINFIGYPGFWGNEAALSVRYIF